MNYYPGQFLEPMVATSSVDQPPLCAPQSNRFIYVKQDFGAVPYKAKVLVNPHFRKTVYINPQFKPKIHVNPNVLRNLGESSTVVQSPPKLRDEVPQTTVISTRTKIVRVPESSQIVKRIGRKRRNSLYTKYKIVKSSIGAEVAFKVNTPKCNVNKFKLDKRSNLSTTTSSKSSRKKYVYVNRFLSISVMAKNVLLKQNTKLAKPGFVNINGILYKKSPNSLRKETEKKDATINRSYRVSSKYKVVRKSVQSSIVNIGKTEDRRKSLIKRYKIIRARKMQIGKNKLKKCNVPCGIYRKFGKCKGRENGTCIKLHNPDQIVLCTRFLQGACLNMDCLLSHKVSPEKMPTCKYYLLGLCSKDDCPYLHVKISPKADICSNFLEGFCKEGAQCDKRHQFLCPVYEKNGSCPKKSCPYPHGNLVRKKSVSNLVAKKFSTKNTSKPNHNRAIRKANVLSEKNCNNRYYDDLKNDSNSDVKAVTVSRPKLGQLPSFIPLFQEL